MTDEQGYNGWKNYETWSVALIIDNDELLQHEAYSIVREALANGNPSSVWAEGEWRPFVVGDRLKDRVERAAEIQLEVSSDNPWSYLWSQLVSAALSDVDWYEVADHYLEDVEQVEA